MNKVTEAFQLGDWNTPGWNKAKEVTVYLNKVTEPITLNFEQKIHLLTLCMEAAIESRDWVELLIAVADELSQS